MTIYVFKRQNRMTSIQNFKNFIDSKIILQNNSNFKKNVSRYAADITMDCKHVVTAGADGDVIVWDALTGENLYRLKHGGIVKYAEWNQKPFEQKYFVTCNDSLRGTLENTPNRICVWEVFAEADEDTEVEQVEEKFQRKLNFIKIASKFMIFT